MHNLNIPAGPGAPKGLIVPAAELAEQFSHASGPGGQGVNTADSRVQLSLDIGTTTALDETQRQRALRELSARLSGTVLIIDAAEYRSQWRNRKAARERLSALLRAAVIPQQPRKPTKPTRGSKRRRLKAKRIRSEVKQNRKPPRSD